MISHTAAKGTAMGAWKADSSDPHQSPQSLINHRLWWLMHQSPQSMIHHQRWWLMQDSQGTKEDFPPSTTTSYPSKTSIRLHRGPVGKIQRKNCPASPSLATDFTAAFGPVLWTYRANVSVLLPRVNCLVPHGWTYYWSP